MKNTILSIALFSISTIFVQAQSIKFGVKAGINYANEIGTNIIVNGDNYKTDAINSYHAGVVAEIALFKGLAFQPELLYYTQGANYKNAFEEIKNELGYVSIPAVLKIDLKNGRNGIGKDTQINFGKIIFNYATTPTVDSLKNTSISCCINSIISCH